MNFSRRTFLQGFGASLTLPFLESIADTRTISGKPPVRFLVVGNPLGMHPENFFPKEFGKNFTMPRTLKSLEWVKDRISILAHTDHNMPSGHGYETSFLSGLMSDKAASYPEKNISIDQVMARHTAGHVRFPSIGAALDSGIGASWTANGIEVKPYKDPKKLFNHLFVNLSAQEKTKRKSLIKDNRSILDAVGAQYSSLRKRVSKDDLSRLDQYQTSIRELEKSFLSRNNWLDKDKPKYNIDSHFAEKEVTIINKYEAIFDMLAFAFQADLTRVATVQFPRDLNYNDLGINRSYHNCTHNGKKPEIVDDLVAIESFQISQMSRFMKKLDSIKEPGTNGSMLDNTIVLFGSGMGYGGSHSNRNLPILVAGGGFKHLGHIDTRSANNINMPLCNLFVPFLNRFGIETDTFNTSNGKLELNYA